MKVHMKTECSNNLARQLLVTILLLLGSLGMVASASADPRDCTPTADQIVLFRDENFRGPCVIKGIGEYPEFESRFSRGGYSSIKVGANVEALVCTNNNYRSECTLVHVDSASQREKWNGNYPHSIIVRRKNSQNLCHPNDDQIAVWDYKYFFGRCRNINLGVYPFSIEPLLAGALRVGRNVEARLCDDDRFGDECIILTPGYYSDWYFIRNAAIFIDHVRALEVRRRNQPPNCVPSANQVALYQFGNFVGRCRVFSIGEHSRDASVGWAHHGVSSMQIGNNVEAVLCNERESQRRCGAGNTLNIRDLAERSFSLTVRRRGETARLNQRSSSDQPAPPVILEYSLTLGQNPVYRGFATWSGRFPTQGRLDGYLTGVANPRRSVWIGFLRSGRDAGDCGSSENYIRLDPGQSLSANQLETLFGSRTPNLPVQFFVCSGAAGQQRADGGIDFPFVRLNLSYVRR